MNWTFWRKKPETRSAGGFTALSMLARAETLTGSRGAAELTATVASCVSLWAGALGRADVTGTDLLTPATLALTARSLALRGEAVFLLEGDGLSPASDWDITTGLSRPRAYRLSLPETGGARSVTALAGEVAHFRINADVREPWRGRAPLSLAPLTADLLATIEAALGEVYASAPLGSSVAPLPELPDDQREALARSFRGARGRTLLRESVTVTAAGGPAPATDWKPQSLSAKLDESEIVAAYDRASAGVAQVFGVDPSLFAPTANGGGLREAERHMVTYAIQPMADLIAQEVSEKIGATVSIDALRPLQAYDAGGRARAFGAVLKALSEAKASGASQADVEAALRFAGIDGAR